jgi:hypothetical protein
VNKPLVIDPALSFSTYLAGSAGATGLGIATDTSGNIYVAGDASSADFPVRNPIQSTYGGSGDIFVAKFNPSGSELIYSTFIGGNSFDTPFDIAVDSSGNACITGTTESTNFPLAGAIQTSLGGNTDSFVAKLNAGGSALVFSTYLGGASGDTALGIATDPSGNIYVTGGTFSANFPLRLPLQGALSGISDIFVTKFTPSGSLSYSTYLGGNNSLSGNGSLERGEGIAVDSAGVAYVTGDTTSTNFPLRNAIQATHRGGSADAFITALNSTGSALVFSTFLGGTGVDSGDGIALDPSGNIYISGLTRSTDFPLANPFQSTNRSVGVFNNELFVARLTPGGAALAYSSYLGGSSNDLNSAIAVDPSGNAYIAAYSNSPDFPLLDPVQNDCGGGTDAVLTKVSPAGAIIYSTQIGGNGNEQNWDVAADASGNAYITGSTNSNNFPVVNPFQATRRSVDAYVVKISPSGSGGNGVAPVQNSAWTRRARVDTNGNGAPDPDDEGIDATRNGNELELNSPRYRSRCGSSGAELMNPSPLTGQFQNATYIKGGTRIYRMVVDRFDSRLRPASALVIEERILANGTVTPVAQARLSPVDGNNDGIAEAFSVVTTSPVSGKGAFATQEVILSLVRYDVNGDGNADFVSIPWAMAQAVGVNTRDSIPDPQVFIPLGDTNGDGIPDSPAFDFNNDGQADTDLQLTPFLAGPPDPSVEHRLYFAQFGDGESGGARLFSQIMLLSLDETRSATARISIRDDAGAPLTVDLNGQIVSGETQVEIPPGGLRILRTDGQGPITSGSVMVRSNRVLTGVILFDGSIGVAGVGNSVPLPDGFVAPMENNTASAINTGVALMNLETSPLAVTLELLGVQGNRLATATAVIQAGGHLARFLGEFNFVPAVELSSFSGLLRVTSPGKLAATVIQTRPGEFATMPVAQRLVSAAITTMATRSHRLNFAQFGDGESAGAQFFSQLMLFNLDAVRPASVRILLQNDSGAPLSVDLNGQVVNGQLDLAIPSGGLSVLRTDARGAVTAGSVAVNSSRPLAGVILFGGSIGVSGVGSSAELLNGFVAPVENNAAQAISTGIAVMNLEPTALTASLELLDANGSRVASGSLPLPANGHVARFLPELSLTPAANLSAFTGVLKVTAPGRISATVIQTRPGQLATQPVTGRLN